MLRKIIKVIPLNLFKIVKTKILMLFQDIFEIQYKKMLQKKLFKTLISKENFKKTKGILCYLIINIYGLKN